MACCYQDTCDEYSVSPVLVGPCMPKPRESPPMCVPCLPRCPKGQLVYCCERPEHSEPPACKHPPARCQDAPRPKPCTKPCPEPEPPCQTCCHPQCRPVKTKYVIPCYRYEDGRIERYVPTRHGRLPMTAYQRNGMQDQMHGYRGAIRYLCSAEVAHGHSCVHTAVEPMRRYYKRITQEVLPIKKKKEKKC